MATVKVCDDCDDIIDGKVYESLEGEDLCEICYGDRKRFEPLLIAAKELGIPECKTATCFKCGLESGFWIANNEGRFCVLCAHNLERSLCPAIHDEGTCAICMRAQKKKA